MIYPHHVRDAFENHTIETSMQVIEDRHIFITHTVRGTEMAVEVVKMFKVGQDRPGPISTSWTTTYASGHYDLGDWGRIAEFTKRYVELPLVIPPSASLFKNSNGE